MIMEQANGGNKRDVVDGQFEDPDDTEAKRLKLTLPAGSAAKDISQVPGVPHQAPFASSLSEGVPLLIPASVARSSNLSPRLPHPPHEAPISPPRAPPAVPPVQGATPGQPVANGVHPDNGMNPWMMNSPAMAAWQHQQQAFMMGRMFAMMQQNPQIMPPQGIPAPHNMMSPPYMPPPGSGWISRPGMPLNAASGMFPYPARPQGQQPPTQQQLSLSTALPWQTEDVWHIPYSHNYHPRTGFVEKEKRPPAKAEKSHPEPPTNMAPFDEAELSKQLTFPLIKGDAEKQFGLTDFEFTTKDVLCGRGGVTNAHQGNIQYRNLVDQYRWHYATVKKSRKSDVARIIVKKIRDNHGRFLKKDGELWYEVGDEAALAKAAQTLREGLAKIYREGLRTKMEGVGDTI